MKKSFIRVSTLVMLVFAISLLGSCKSSKKKNKCNTCPTWDQVDIKDDVSE